MSDLATERLLERIAAIIERVSVLARERDEIQREYGELRFRLESQEKEKSRLRTVLDEAVRELRQG